MSYTLRVYLMSTHRPILVTDNIYHLYNKSIADVPIFYSLENLRRTLRLVDYYRYDQRVRLSKFCLLPPAYQQDYLTEITKNQPLIDIFAFSFMPNHYHLLVKQLQNNGIKQFISNFQNSYSKSFNLINKRNGSLFLHSFKSKRIINKNLLTHVCRYIHINHVTSRLIEFNQLASYSFSSYSWYLDQSLNKFINTNLITSYFKTEKKFIKFHKSQINYQRKLKEIKDSLFD